MVLHDKVRKILLGPSLSDPLVENVIFISPLRQKVVEDAFVFFT